VNLLETILDSQGGGAAISQIAKQLGLPEGLAKQAVGALTPALSRGLQRNALKSGGLDSLLGALGKGDHQRYVEDPSTLEKKSSVEDGNAILGHILGSKDVSRNVAAHASQQTGIDPSVLKKMLPMLGAVAMGSLSKQTKGGGQLSALSGSAGSDAVGMLSGFLDADKDGDATDDLLNLAKKLF
jgi:hypothetical protein